jgi:hypothetical protein
MTRCFTLDDVLAAADADSLNDTPLSQAQADLIAALLAPYRAAIDLRALAGQVPGERGDSEDSP